MYEIAFFALAPFIALFYEGLLRKLNAKFQNRIGPPVLQPFYDLFKLLDKKEMKTQNDPFYKHAPLLYFISIYALFLFIPFAIVSFEYDFILILYLTILASSFYVLAGLSSDNPFGIVGSVREMILMVVYEITLVISLFNFMIRFNVTSLSSLGSNLMILSLPISSVCLFIVSLMEVHVTPFDTTEAPTEIMGGVRTEYSGRNLALMNLSMSMKRLFFLMLLPMLLLTRDFVLIIPISLGLLFLYGFLHATTPRYRVDQAFKFYFFVMVLTLVDMILIMRGIVWA